MIWDKYGYLTMVPREERGEWYEKTSLSNVDEVELIKTIQISKQNRAGQIAHSDRGEQVRIEMKREWTWRYGQFKNRNSKKQWRLRHESVAARDPAGPGPRDSRPWRVTQLEESHLHCHQVTVNSLLLPPFRWSRTGIQIVTVLMWLKDEFCAKILFVQLIWSIDSTFNPICRCHSYCFSI